VVSAFPQWSRQIGELASMPPWSPTLLRWTLLFLPVTPWLLWRAARGNRDRAGWFWLPLLLMLVGLACWQARWGYFLALVFSMSLPWQLAALPRRWMALALFGVGLWPVAVEWSGQWFPAPAERALRAESRADQVALRDLALQLRLLAREQSPLPVLAPWWQSPALAYWSGQPCVAGSSHESLPGTVDASRFYLSEEPEAAEAILDRRQVACVVAYEPTRVVAVSRGVLGLEGGEPEPPQSMAVALYRHPHSIPSFLKLAYANRAFRLFLRPAVMPVQPRP
jgi:hypothetical protein